MKKLMLVVTLIVVTISLSAVANAQSNKIWKANIPYSFHVEDQNLPAGTYLVQWAGGRLRIASEDGKYSASAIALPKEGRTTQASSRLKFNNYAGERFLREIFFAGQEQSRELLRSKLEISYARRVKPITGIVAAGQ